MTDAIARFLASTDERLLHEPGHQRSAPFTFGRYEVIGELSSGGMGAVYLARQKGPGGFGRNVALKVMLPDLARKVPNAARMFVEEMRVLASIDHNNVVRILDFGEEQQVLYMAMEHLPGVTLSSLRAQIGAAGRAFPPDLAASLLAQACRGLHAAHELRDELGNPRGLVHRDVTPQNIMCCKDGAVKIIDFGIVWAKDRLVEATSCPQLKGKLAYMSPEQTAAASPLTRRSDVFSVGVILHELLSGQPLFRRGTDVATIMAVREAPVPSLRALRGDVPPRLDDLVLRTLARDPALRPESAAAVADELAAIVREAGGRFAHPEAAARCLESLGASLAARPPRPLGQAPWFARVPRAAPPAPAAAPAEHRAVAPAVLPVDPWATTQEPDGLLEVVAPQDGAYRDFALPDGRRLVLQSLALDERLRVPTPLVFAAAPALLPTPLLVSPRPNALYIEVDRRAVLAGGQRASLYHNAADPSTRVEGLQIPECARHMSFDVGHRRARVQRILVGSTAARGGARRAVVEIAPFHVEIATDKAPKQLVVLSAVDPADGAIHLACVSIS
ncbi:serine/threonine protein kinase [Sorangium sp. So ce1335]|uniref:serine/threonine protein kinase n=1 Tax=Sorangium sp. So ce1335 TaxID=3133335 RepID=UPI003F635215